MSVHNFTKLPPELWEMVAKYLEIKQFQRLRSTCQLTRKALLKSPFLFLPAFVESVLTLCRQQGLLIGKSIFMPVNTDEYKALVKQVKSRFFLSSTNFVLPITTSDHLIFPTPALLSAGFNAASSSSKTTASSDLDQELQGTKIIMPENYELSFDILPFAMPTTPSSIFHFTGSGSDSFPSGSRLPAIFMSPYSSSLEVCIDDEQSFSPASMKHIQPLPLGETTKVSLRVHHTHVQLLYNNQLVGSMQLASRKIMKSVIAYASNPWYGPAPAIVYNAKLQALDDSFTATCSLCQLPDTLVPNFTGDLVFGNPVCQIDMPPDYCLSFTINPFGYRDFESSVLHITSNNREAGNGGMIPAIFMKQNASTLVF